jgi:adenosylmethionine-8-amino-7-oxononanoate aminotransferase
MQAPATTPSIDLDTLWRPFTQHALRQQPLVITSGTGCTVVDSEGKQYLDAFAGLWCVNLGYGQERLVEAAASQMRRLPFTPLSRPAPVALELASRLVQMLPGELNHIQYVNSGSEAAELALKVARQYARQKYPRENRFKIIARYRGYDGWTFGALSASGQYVRKMRIEPLTTGFIHVRPPDTYRLFAGLSPSEAAHRLAQELEEVIEFEGPETVAAFIGEPIIGGGGVIVPPDEYWPLIRQVCDRYNVLLIHDEVITGFGRTGRMFGTQHWGVAPDIVMLAKGISSGYIPLAAVGFTDEVFDGFKGELADNVHLNQISTYGGHPVACAVGLECLALIDELGVVDNAQRMGARLLGGLHELQRRHAVIGDVRGKGLMCGIDLVQPGTRDPLPAVASQVAREAQARGLLVGQNWATVPRLESVVSVGPALIVSPSEIDRVIEVLDAALSTVKL